MASKRKLEEDADALSPPSKSAKVSDEVTRSGRVRKKPARFQDTEEEFDEDGGPIVPLPTGAAEMAKTTEPSKPKSGQKLQTTVVNIPEVAVIESPKVAKVITTPKMVTAAKKMPQKTTGVDAGAPTPQIIPQPARVVPVARVVSPTSQQESAEQTKTGRVRKKSTKVLEMEAFEEAERTKTTKKAAGEVPQRNQKSPTVKKVGQTSDKPASTIPAELSPTGQLPVSLFADKPPVKVEPAEQLLDTSIPPQALSAPAIQGKINPALVNLPPFPPSKLGTPASKKAKKKKDDPKLLPDTLSGIPPMPPSAMATSVSSKKATKAKPRKSVEVMEVDLSSVSTSMPVKEEPLEGSGVRGQPTQVLNPSVLSAVANTVRVKREPASPSKTQKKLMIAVQDETDPLLAETGIHVPPKSAATAVVGGGGSKSVIKMLLNTPTQFSKPSVSTQSINSEKSAKSAPLLFQNRSPPSDSDLLIDASFVKNESTEISGSNLSLKLKNVTVPDQLSTATHTVSESILLGDQGHSSMDDDSFEKKKPGKRVPLRKSISIEQLDDDDDDDEDDDDDDDFDNPDDSGEWEFENQDGKLVIADFATKGLEMDEDIGQMESEEKSKSKKSRTKPKTVPRKKTAKSKSDMPDNEDGKKQGKQTKEKTKKRLTAYTMWCNTVRTKVLNENRGMDSGIDSLGRGGMQAIHQEKQDDMPEHLPRRSSVVNQELESDPEREVQTLPNNMNAPHLENTLSLKIQSSNEVTHPVDDGAKPPYLEEQSLHEQAENVTISSEMETALSSSAVLPDETERTETTSSNMENSSDHTQSILNEFQTLPLETQILLQKVITLPKNAQILLKKLQNLPAESSMFPIQEQTLSEENPTVRQNNKGCAETLQNKQKTLPDTVKTLDSTEGGKSLHDNAANTDPDEPSLLMEIESINDNIENLEESQYADSDYLRTPQADGGEIFRIFTNKPTTKESEQLRRSNRIIKRQKPTQNKDKVCVVDLESSQGEEFMIEIATSGSNWSSESENELSEKNYRQSNHDCRSKASDTLKKRKSVIQFFHSYALKTKPIGSQENGRNQGKDSHQTEKLTKDSKKWPFKKKSKSRKKYEIKHKLHCIEFAKKNGNAAAGRHFNMSEKNIRLWRTMEGKLLQQNGGFRAGRVKYPKLEEALATFVSECKAKEIPLTLVSVVNEAARLMKASVQGIVSKRRSNLYRWCRIFLKRHCIDLDMVNDVHDSSCKAKKKFTIKEKLKCVAYAKQHGNSAAGKHFNTTVKTVREWMKNEENLRRRKSAIRVNCMSHPKVEAALSSFVLECEKTNKPLTIVTFVEEARRLLKSLNDTQHRNNRSLYSFCRSFLQRHNIDIDIQMTNTSTKEEKLLTFGETSMKKNLKCDIFEGKKSVEKLTGLKPHTNVVGKSLSVTSQSVSNSDKNGNVELNLDCISEPPSEDDMDMLTVHQRMKSNAQERQKFSNNCVRQINKSKSAQVYAEAESASFEEPTLLMEIESINEDKHQDEVTDFEASSSADNCDNSRDGVVDEEFYSIDYDEHLSDAYKSGACCYDSVKYPKTEAALVSFVSDCKTKNMPLTMMNVVAWAKSLMVSNMDEINESQNFIDDDKHVRNWCRSVLQRHELNVDMDTHNVTTMNSSGPLRSKCEEYIKKNLNRPIKQCVSIVKSVVRSGTDLCTQSAIDHYDVGTSELSTQASSKVAETSRSDDSHLLMTVLLQNTESENYTELPDTGDTCSKPCESGDINLVTLEPRRSTRIVNRKKKSVGNKEKEFVSDFDSSEEEESVIEEMISGSNWSEESDCEMFSQNTKQEKHRFDWRSLKSDGKNTNKNYHKKNSKAPESDVNECIEENKSLEFSKNNETFDSLDNEDDTSDEFDSDKETIGAKKSRRSYKTEQKLECVEYAKLHSNRAAGRHFNVSERSIRLWRKMEAKIRNQPSRFRMSHTVRNPEMENALLSYVTDLKEKGKVISMKDVKAKAVYLFKTIQGKDCENSLHIYDWIKRFLNRQEIKFDMETQVDKKNLEETPTMKQRFEELKSIPLKELGNVSTDAENEGNKAKYIDGSASSQQNNENKKLKSFEYSSVSTKQALSDGIQTLGSEKPSYDETQNSDKGDYVTELPVTGDTCSKPSGSNGINLVTLKQKRSKRIVNKQKSCAGNKEKEFLSDFDSSEDEERMNEDIMSGSNWSEDSDNEMLRQSTKQADAYKIDEESGYKIDEESGNMKRCKANESFDSSEYEEDASDDSDIDKERKGTKKSRRSYQSNQKLECIEYAKLHGNRAAGRHFNVCEKSVRMWRAMEAKIRNQPSRFRVRHNIVGIRNPQLETALLSYVAELKMKGKAITMKRMKAKAKYLFKVMQDKKHENSHELLYWVKRFLNRQEIKIDSNSQSTNKKDEKMPTYLQSSEQDSECTKKLAIGVKSNDNVNRKTEEGINFIPNQSVSEVEEKENENICAKNDRKENKTKYTDDGKSGSIGSQQNSVSNKLKSLEYSSVGTEQAVSDSIQTLESEKSICDEKRNSNEGEYVAELPELPVNGDTCSKPCESNDINLVIQEPRRSTRIISKQKSSVGNEEKGFLSDFDSSEDEESIIEEITSGSNWSEESESEMLRQSTEQKKHSFGLKNFKSNDGNNLCSESESSESEDAYESKEESINLKCSENSGRFDSLDNEETRGTKKSRRSYITEQKLECVEYAKLHSNRSAAKHFNVSRRSVRLWRAMETKIRSQPRRCHIRHSSVGIKNPELETALVSYVAELKGKGQAISMRDVKTQAIYLFKVMQGKEYDNGSRIHNWVRRFLKRQGINLDVKTRSYKKNAENKTSMQKFEELKSKPTKKPVTAKAEKLTQFVRSPSVAVLEVDGEGNISNIHADAENDCIGDYSEDESVEDSGESDIMQQNTKCIGHNEDEWNNLNVTLDLNKEDEYREKAGCSKITKSENSQKKHKQTKDSKNLNTENSISDDINEDIKVKKKRKSYNVTHKLECVEYAKKYGNYAAGRHYNMSEKNVREWRKFETDLKNWHNREDKKFRRKFQDIKSPQVETAVLSYVSECEGKGTPLIMTELAEVVRSTFRSLVGKEFCRNTEVYAWCKRFLTRHGIKIDTSVPRKVNVVPGKKRQKYTLQLKLECVEHAKKFGKKSAMAKFNVGEKFVRDCKKIEQSLKSVPNSTTSTRYRRVNHDQKKYPELRTAIASYVHECQNLKRRIRLKHVHEESLRLFKVIYDKDPEEEGFKGSGTWCSRLVRNILMQSNVPLTRKKRTVKINKRSDS